MKTEKQIELKAMEKGNQIAAFIENSNLDEITIPVTLLKNAAWEEMEKPSNLQIMPFLSEGALRLEVAESQNAWNIPIEVICYFKVLEDEAINLDIVTRFPKEYLTDEMDLYEWVYSTKISKLVLKQDESVLNPKSYADYNFNVVTTEYSDATVAVYEKQSRKQEEIESYINKNARRNNTAYINWFVEALMYFGYLLEHPELKFIENNEQVINKTEKTPKNDNNKVTEGLEEETSTENVKVAAVKKQIVYLNGIKYVTSNPKHAKAVKGKKLVRHCDLWGVRGHWRYYSNGKKVYIKPYEKGSARTKSDENAVRKQKQYRVES